LFFLVNLYSPGKAEPGSAGEQPVRNNLDDWNDQEIGNFLNLFLLLVIPRVYAFTKLK